MHALIVYSKDQLAQRNGLAGNSCWIAYKGIIHDVSSSELFHNGKHFRLHAGQDLTSDMPDAPHMDDVLEKFPQVGRLED
jgi:predicted heme/steroid binding protein